MATVHYRLNTDDPISEETLLELAALKDRPIDYSDIPKITHEEFEKGRQIAAEMRKKQMFSLRLQTSAIDWWKQNVGTGYTGVMARLLEKATKHAEWIKECL